jgi:protein-disulfide isomerase
MMVRAFILTVFGLVFALPTLFAPSHAAEPAASKSAAKAAPTPGPPLIAANPEATATVVALIDYDDPGAQMLRQKLGAFGKDNKDIKLEVKPWAADDPLARLSAKAAYAAQRQNKFPAFNDAILRDPGSHTYLSLRDLANIIGLDWAQFTKDLDDPKLGEAVDANAQLAAKLKATADPAFVAGGQVFTGPWDKVDFKAIALAARNAKGGDGATAR